MLSIWGPFYPDPATRSIQLFPGVVKVAEAVFSEQKLRFDYLRERTSETLTAVADAVGITKSSLARWEIDGAELRLGTILRLMRHYGAAPSAVLARLESDPRQAAVVTPTIRPLVAELLGSPGWREFFWERLLFDRLQSFVEEGESLLFDPWGKDGPGGTCPRMTLGPPGIWSGLREQLLDSEAVAQEGVNLFSVVSANAPEVELGLLAALATASVDDQPTELRVLDLRLAGRLVRVHHREGGCLAERAVQRLLTDIDEQFPAASDRSLLVVGWSWAQLRGAQPGELWGEVVLPLLDRLQGGEGSSTRVILLQPSEEFFSMERPPFDVHWRELQFRHLRHPGRHGGSRQEDWLLAHARWRLRGFESSARLVSDAADEFIPAQVERLRASRSQRVLQGINDLDIALTRWLADKLTE